MAEPVCTCARSGSWIYEPEFECDVHGDREAKASMTVKEHAEASAKALLGIEDGEEST